MACHAFARAKGTSALRERNRHWTIGLTAFLAGALAGPVCAQAPHQPDFSSGGWTTSIAGDFMPVPGLPAPLRSDPAHPFLTNVEARERGLTPGYRIGDLTNPNLKPAVKAAMKKDNDEVLSGKIAYTPSTSCEPAGVPWFLLQPSILYFVQGPKEVVMIQAYDSQVRHILLDVPHSSGVKPSWYGESVGHYEGDTLVIDTIGLNRKTFVDAYRTPHSEKLHVVERWKLSGDGKGLEVAMRVDDPETYFQPWQGILRYRRSAEPVQEAICAENNLQFDYHMPVAARADF
jgi:hypothetical protein